MHIIGVGKAGSNIAKKFKKYPQYTTHCIGLTQEYKLPDCKTMEEMEQNTPDFPELIEKVSGDTIVLCAGGGIQSGALMRLLGALTNVNIKMVYIRPEINFVSPVAKQREKLAYNVLQEYARSGMFERLYIVHNTKISNILGNLSVGEYFNKINEFIAETVHMINYFKNSEAVMSNITQPRDVCRISTIGVYDLEEEKENYFFELENIREKNFYYSFSDENLNENNNLLNEIRQQIEKAGQEEKIDVSYNISRNEYGKNFAYLMAHTNFIQK